MASRLRSTGLPFQRSIIAIDIEGSTAETNTAKARLRDVMYDVLQKALQGGGVSDDHRDPFVDRGDGVLVLVHADDRVPKALLLNSVIPTLHGLLEDHCAAHPNERFRLRAAVHAGDVHYDRNGCFGEALDITFRLLDAAVVKRRLREATTSLVVVISDDIYRSVVRQGYLGSDHNNFESFRIQIAGQRHLGWVHVPLRANSG
jgi:hypothetical protein